MTSPSVRADNPDTGTVTRIGPDPAGRADRVNDCSNEEPAVRYDSTNPEPLNVAPSPDDNDIADTDTEADPARPTDPVPTAKSTPIPFRSVPALE